VETIRHIVRLVVVVPGLEGMYNRDIFLSSVKLIDLILLAAFMRVVGIGPYSLFISRNLPVPDWLRTTQVDELKYKLAGIVAVMLGVLFWSRFSRGQRSRPDASGHRHRRTHSCSELFHRTTSREVRSVCPSAPCLVS
jgi:uncharacterized membrane protein YqhA